MLYVSSAIDGGHMLTGNATCSKGPGTPSSRTLWYRMYTYFPKIETRTYAPQCSTWLVTETPEDYNKAKKVHTTQGM